jgi:predicted transcriptional regulator
MATISLKLSDELKEQVARVAAGLEMSPHAFMVEAIKLATHNVELHLAFLVHGYVARKQTIKTGKAYEELIERFEDLEFNAIAKSRKGLKTIRISLDDL